MYAVEDLVGIGLSGGPRQGGGARGTVVADVVEKVMAREMLVQCSTGARDSREEPKSALDPVGWAPRRACPQTRSSSRAAARVVQ